MLSLVWLLIQAAPVAPAPASVPWTPVERANGTTGNRSVSAAAVTPDGAGRLVVRCDHAPGAVLSVQFIAREPYRGFGVQPVSLQFDGGTALIDNWELLGAGVVEREEHATTTLTTGIARARRIHLRTADRTGAPLDLTFEGPASDAPIRRVVEACGQTLGRLPAPTPAARMPAPVPVPVGGPTK